MIAFEMVILELHLDVYSSDIVKTRVLWTDWFLFQPTGMGATLPLERVKTHVPNSTEIA